MQWTASPIFKWYLYYLLYQKQQLTLANDLCRYL